MQAFLDLAEGPGRPGTIQRPELVLGAFNPAMIWARVLKASHDKVRDDRETNSASKYNA